jgi:ATP/ADP translocase
MRISYRMTSGRQDVQHWFAHHHNKRTKRTQSEKSLPSLLSLCCSKGRADHPSNNLLILCIMTMAVTSAVAGLLSTAAPSALNQALLVRGGAAILAANAATSLVKTVRGGARMGGSKNKVVAPTKTKRGGSKNKVVEPPNTKRFGSKNKAVKPATTKRGLSITPEGKSVIYMAAGMSLHYLGYSLARSITVALFTSSTTGYAGIPGAFPFALAFVSPVALLLLMGYARVLEKHGPREALNRSTLFCSAVIIAISAVMEATERSGAKIFNIPAMKFITGPLFVFRESYVQLLTSQYWSFMASVLTPNQSAMWFAPISGLTSIASAIGGLAVSRLADTVKLSGALACTGLSLIMSLVATNAAYSIAEKHGFVPSNQPLKGASKNKGKRRKKGDAGKVDAHKEVGMIEKAKTIFARAPILRALFIEILASQGLATLLNVCFVHSLGESIADDHLRAGWVGKYYALINFISMSLQFFVLPVLMQLIEPKQLWRCIPIISLLFTTFQAVQESPTLYIISASLLVMKVLEYSARRMLDEMVYVPLDFESRFVGKEIIGVFGYRFGKSAMSLALSGLTSIFGNFDIHQLSILCNVAALYWTKTAWTLSSLVPTKGEAQDAYVQSRR